MRRALAVLALVILPSAVFTQGPQNTPKFDAADINLRARTGLTNQPGMTGGVLRGGRYDLRNATMLDLVATAYAIADRDHRRGAGVARANRFDIAAKAPQDTSPANVRLMLQGLLAERFKLDPPPGHAPDASGLSLTVGKAKHKMKEATGPGSDARATRRRNHRRPSR